MTAPHGPYESEEQALADPAVRAVYAAMRAAPGPGAMREGGAEMILGACGRAGVKPGAYDTRIIRWLAGFEPQACAVVAGLIARAAGAGQPVGGADARCVRCGGPITGYTDPYDGVTPRWRHVPRRDPVAEFLDEEHGAEPASGKPGGAP